MKEESSYEEIIAYETAKILVNTRSVSFNAKNPYTLTSGRVSPVYVDCRRLISFPRERTQIINNATRIMCDRIGFHNVDYLAGGETAGIPYAAFVAEKMEKPMLYVRKRPKGFGKMAQIEGCIAENSPNPNVVLIEDLQTDGGSKKVFIDALRKAGCRVEHSMVIFHYGIFPKSEQNMHEMGIKLHALTTWWDILSYVKENGCFDDYTISEVENFLHAPENWQNRRHHAIYS